jgi:NAD+ synthase (glutamine-hydrolysing)
LIVGLPEYADGALYNAALVIRDGAVIARCRKQLLPNYGVFDEKRHFTAGNATPVFELKGRQLGLCICEDVWGPGPAALAKAGGAEVLININASPFEQSKARERREVSASSALTETGLPILYVNMVGGQDDLVFDGGSLAVNGDGSVGFSAPDFVDDILSGALRRRHAERRVRGSRERRSARLSGAGAGDARLRRSQWISGRAGGFVRRHRQRVDRGDRGRCARPRARVGGVDAVALHRGHVQRRCAARSRSARHSLFDDRDRSRRTRLSRTLLTPSFAGRKPDLTEENLQSRCRGVLLMALSNKFGNVVLTTGNKSEMAVGYATLYGDMCGGFAPIKDVYKTLVYQLAIYRNTLAPAGKPVIPERVITREPSAELRHEQKDSDSLPPYDVLDPILQAYVEDCRSIPEIVAMGFERGGRAQGRGLGASLRIQASPGAAGAEGHASRFRSRAPLSADCAQYGDL